MRSVHKDLSFSGYVWMLDEIDHISPVTGLTASQMSIYYSKLGEDAILLTTDDFSWSETDSLTMPGIYYYSITSTDVTDTLGPLVLMFKGIQTSPPVQTDRAREGLNVVVVPADEALGTGTWKITINSVGLQNVLILVYDTSNTQLLFQGNTNAAEQIFFYLQNGPYKIRAVRAGWAFELLSITVAGVNASYNMVGNPI